MGDGMVVEGGESKNDYWFGVCVGTDLGLRMTLLTRWRNREDTHAAMASCYLNAIVQFPHLYFH